jgi:UDP-glucose 6-dehydrogenase
MLRETIVVVGFGWIGQANGLALAIDGHDVAFYDVGQPVRQYEEYGDLYGTIASLDSVLDKDGPHTAYLVCAGDSVDAEGNQDISSIERALASLRGAQGTVVLRSTVLPSYLKGLEFDVYLPEFLHERAAVRECLHPRYLVVARKRPLSRVPRFVETWRSRSARVIDCSPDEASHIKYLSNLWNALRIAFVNEFGSSIDRPVDPETVGRIATMLRFILEDRPYQRYGRSFGGHCLPKDLRAYVKWCEDNGRPCPLLRGALASNAGHEAREKENPHLPEWFSNEAPSTGSD